MTNIIFNIDINLHRLDCSYSPSGEEILINYSMLHVHSLFSYFIFQSSVLEIVLVVSLWRCMEALSNILTVKSIFFLLLLLFIYNILKLIKYIALYSKRCDLQVH